MEVWTVVGVDTKASEKNKNTGAVIAGVKFHVYGDNFDPSDPDRCLGQCVSVIFVSNEDRTKFQFDPMPGDQIRVAYNRWGRLSLLEPVF